MQRGLRCGNEFFLFEGFRVWGMGGYLRPLKYEPAKWHNYIHIFIDYIFPESRCIRCENSKGL